MLERTTSPAEQAFGDIAPTLTRPSPRSRMTEPSHTNGMSPLMTLLFGVAAGVAVGNLYWAQPLLVQIAEAFQVSATAAGALITATQIGYAIGVLLLVPLGDTLNRRRFIPLVMAASALALLLAGIAPSFSTLIASFALIGLTTVAGQILVPLAGDLARAEERGRVVGSIASGVLMGILLSRTISGLLAHALGWQSIYFGAAAVTLALAAILAVKLPEDRPRIAVRYGQLLVSVAAVVSRHRAVQITLLISACVFSVFTMFWTGITFLLSSPAFGFTVAQVGMVGLVGLAGALAARRAGKLHDRGWSIPVTGAALSLVLVSLGIALAGSRSIHLVLLAVLLIDIAIHAINVLNQTRLFSIDPASRSRLNTAFVFCNFVGGAVGSALTGVLWEAGNWPLVIAGQALITLIAFTAWLFGRATLSASTA